ncbi:hypothetical protein GW17_00041165 [Ensete ventricosum]|nr:hypothetical protein GW17_00041165 [Ensete ventricosum]
MVGHRYPMEKRASKPLFGNVAKPEVVRKTRFATLAVTELSPSLSIFNEWAVAAILGFYVFFSTTACTLV